MVYMTEKIKTFWKTLLNVLESRIYFFRCSQEGYYFKKRLSFLMFT